MVSTAIEDQVLRRANEVRALAGQLSEISETQGEGVIRQAAYLSADFDVGISVLQPDGALVISNGSAEAWKAYQPTLSAGIATLERNTAKEVFVSRVGSGVDEHGISMVVIARATDGSAFVAGAFSTAPLMEHVFADVFALNPETSAMVVASTGEVLFQKGFAAPAEPLDQYAGVADALAGKYGATQMNVQGSEQVIAYSPVPQLGWAVVIVEPWEQVASPLLETTHLAPLVFVPVLLLALLAVFFGIRQIIQPLQALAAQSGALGRGDYRAIEKPVGGVSEIRRLQQELIHMARKLQVAQQSLHRYIGVITSGQEEERRRLSRELHDDTIQSLIALKQRVQLVEMDWEGHPVSTALAELEGVAEQTIENLRRMVRALRPIYLEDLGLVAAIEMLASDTGEKLGSGIAFHCQGRMRRLDAATELALYRIVQEALNNIIRHSGASQASVQMTFHADTIQITIKDNGKGFTVPESPAEFAPGDHFGLLGMFERADLLGGEIHITSSPGNGTSLSITAPFTPVPTGGSTVENQKPGSAA